MLAVAVGGHAHDLGDLLGAATAIATALVMLATYWYPVNLLLSAGIGVLILWSSWRLLRASVDVPLEATQKGVDTGEVRADFGGVAGVANVHDLHIWTVTSGLVALSGHVEVTGDRDWHGILAELAGHAPDRFGIVHVTLQPEEPARLAAPFRGCSLDSPQGRQACLLVPPGTANTEKTHAHLGQRH
ncbi:MAG: cobalt-zinc-cadmium efflux system protein [Thermomicrobiales bacterium]|nr:cobalt-zinc-cadmium efflux system protein [Thermomicrobiales bacterium]